MKTTAKIMSLASLSLLIATLFSQQASAQTTTENKEQAVSVIGFGAGYVPEYEGAQKRRAIPVLFGEYRNSNGFFISSMKGIGMEKQAGDIEVSAALSYRGGRRDNRSNSSLFGSDDLKGMGDIPGSAIASLEASTLLAGNVKIHGSANLALNHRDNGNSFKFGVSPLVYQTGSDQVGLDFSAEYADAKFNQTYFGVTAQQSQNSGYLPYNLKAGFNQLNASVAWNHVIDQHWSVRTMLGVTQLTGDVANSPIVKNKTNPMLITTVNYRF
jgi:outer membrane scaffolding protein for murein synthesis (MipA/OmpV family)